MRGKPPVISFDDFITVFEEGEAPKIDWRLAWDLVIIRVIETLYQNKWLQKHQKELLESEELEELRKRRNYDGFLNGLLLLNAPAALTTRGLQKPGEQILLPSKP